MLRNITRKVVRTLYNRPLPHPSAQEQQLITELRSSFRQLPMFEVDKVSGAAAAWQRNMNRLRGLVLEENPREFLRWDVITQTMFVDDAPYVRAELRSLKQRPDWNVRWRPAIEESPVGRPMPYVFCPRSSGNLIHHAYHLAQFEEKTGGEIQHLDLVLEFGGGYGSMCRLFHNLGFRGTYIIFDLPHFSLLQEYYLRALGLRLQPGAQERVTFAEGVYCISDVEKLTTILDSSEFSKSLFLGTWSISETPIHVREKFVPLLSRFNSFLIAYQERFEDVDNIGFFAAWKQTKMDIVWHHWPIAHIPGNHYLVGMHSRGAK